MNNDLNELGSHEIVAWIKRILKVEKTGHSGTLDPKTTGTHSGDFHRSHSRSQKFFFLPIQVVSSFALTEQHGSSNPNRVPAKSTLPYSNFMDRWNLGQKSNKDWKNYAVLCSSDLR